MCKQCQQNNINGRRTAKNKRKMGKKRRYVRGLSKGYATTLGMNTLIGAAGAVVANMAIAKVLPADQAKYSNYALIALGIGAAMMSKNATVAQAGMGAAVIGGYNVINDLVDGQGVNLLPPGRNFAPQVYPGGMPAQAL